MINCKQNVSRIILLAFIEMQVITGVIPPETPHILGKPALTIPKKMGTEFTIPAKFFSPDKEV